MDAGSVVGDPDVDAAEQAHHEPHDEAARAVDLANTEGLVKEPVGASARHGARANEVAVKVVVQDGGGIVHAGTWEGKHEREEGEPEPLAKAHPTDNP